VARAIERAPGRARGGDSRTLRRIAGLFKPQRGALVAVFLLTVLTTLLDLVNPLLTRVLFDEAIGGRDLQLLLLVVGAMLVAPTIRVVISVLHTYLSERVGQHLLRDLRDRLYDHLQRLPLHFFTSTRAGEVQSRLANDIGGIEGVLTQTFSNVVRNISSSVSIVAAMLILSPPLTLVSLGLLPVVYLVSSRVGRLNRAVTKERQESLAALSALMQETLSVSGALLVKTFGRQGLMRERFAAENRRLAALGVRKQMVGISLFMASMLIFSLAPVFVYLVAGWQIIVDPRAGLTLGTIVAFTALQGRLVSGFSPITQLLSTKVQLQGALALFDRIFEYLDLPVEIADKPGALRLDPARVRGAIAFRDVSFAYRGDESPAAPTPAAGAAGETGAGSPALDRRQAALRNVSFDAAPGQLVALVGPSGAGKTTAISLVARLYDVDGGAVEIDGHDVRDVALASLSEVVGTVTQETYLFHASVRENLLFARPDATEEELVAAARAAAIHDRIVELDRGYDTPVGERGYKLSGGEKQRIAIARALLKDPRILILDEATSALDTRAERLVQGALETLLRGRTTLAIAHRLSTILAADLILVLDRGEVVERGTHRELLRRDGLYAQLYRQQFARRQEAPAGAYG
jgi:ATP-binding cassette subfamily B protein